VLDTARTTSKMSKPEGLRGQTLSSRAPVGGAPARICQIIGQKTMSRFYPCRSMFRQGLSDTRREFDDSATRRRQCTSSLADGPQPCQASSLLNVPDTSPSFVADLPLLVDPCSSWSTRSTRVARILLRVQLCIVSQTDPTHSTKHFPPPIMRHPTTLVARLRISRSLSGPPVQTVKIITKGILP
jgi:hypothetical protein